MTKSKLFVGNIKICTKYEVETVQVFDKNKFIRKVKYSDCKSEIFKEGAILFKVGKNKYIDFDYFTCCKDYLNIVTCINTKTPLDNIILNTFETHKGGLFVDSESLVQIEDYEDIPDIVSDKRLVRKILTEKNKKVKKITKKKQTI